MEIREAKFIKGIVGTDDILKSQKEQIAFIGRSNVGKSTLINNLTGNKGLVKVSGQPGKTKQINFFSAIFTYQNKDKKTDNQIAEKNSNEESNYKRNKEVYLVDLPGYGYAKISQDRREKMRKMILWYFISGEAKIKKVVLIVDAKAGLKEFDLEMIAVLQEYGPQLGYDFVIAFNKIDKLNQKQTYKNLNKAQEQLGDTVKIIPLSAKTGKGRNKLLEWIGM